VGRDQYSTLLGGYCLCSIIKKGVKAMRGICPKFYLKILAITFCVIALPTLIKAQDTTNGIVWELPIQISPDTLNASSPGIVVQGDTIHVTWWNSGLKYPYVRSVDGGKIFEQTREIAQDSITFVSPAWITATGSRLHGFFRGYQNHGTTYFTFHMYSDDKGDTWSLPYKFSDSLIYHSFTSYGDTIIIRSSRPNQFSLITRSFDDGTSWFTDSSTHMFSTKPNIVFRNGTLHLIEVSPYVLEGCQNEGFVAYFKSADFGKTWSDRYPIAPVCSVYSVDPFLVEEKQSASSRILALWDQWQYGCGNNDSCHELIGRFFDSDSFQSPFVISTGYAFQEVRAAMKNNLIAIIYDSLAYLGGKTKMIVSKDGGIHWSPSFWVAPDGNTSLAISANAIHLVWSQYIGESKFAIFYRRGTLLTTPVKGDNFASMGFHLAQNFPNPFNPKTEIRFYLDVASFVSLKIYDVFGRDVATLLNQRVEAGNHGVEFDALLSSKSELPSGIYFYRLQAGKFTDIKKMLFLK
jgi:hypothetical protein